MEEKIFEYSKIGEAINGRLSSQVLRNYGTFVKGMQQLRGVPT